MLIGPGIIKVNDIDTSISTLICSMVAFVTDAARSDLYSC